MKNKKPAILILLAFILLWSCEKEIPTFLVYESYAFSNLDENGGDWKPILLTSNEEISVVAPETVTSSNYQTELLELKTAMESITPAQRHAIHYWTNNPINRWNEIALELVAKYNLIPGPNEDGTYSVPNAANPAATPVFPFAHPPYASRVFAYLSVAQFDGSITAWHYKYKYNRPAPYKQANFISYAYVENNLPSYPSEGAVVARTSKRILTTMFPLEAAYLDSLEAEHLTTLMLSGGYVKSDVMAGIEIGDAVATKALKRASIDGMKYAQSSKAIADSIKAAAFSRFGWQWENMELPQRAVGLTPLFGAVKMWNVPNLEATRPVPPPNIGSDEYNENVAILKNYAANITPERRRIANFWQDGIGTYTPPGHWNRIAKELIVKYQLNPLRTARTLAYMNMAIMDGGISCWDAKYYYHYPRPIQSIKGFKTILGTPNFPAYTSGHSVFSAAAAEVLAYVFPQEADNVQKWAEESAMSRVYGGIHWLFDATNGTQQGRNVAKYTIDVAQLDGAD